MKNVPVIALVIVTVACASVAHAAAPPHAAASRVATPRLASWVKRANAAEWADVTHLQLQPPRADAAVKAMPPQGDRIAMARVARSWVERFLTLVTTRMTYAPGEACAPSGPQSYTSDELAIDVRFGTGAGAARAFLLSREGCIRLDVNGAPAGRLSLDRAGADVLDLVREALPADAALWPDPEVFRVPPADDDAPLPKFGEYVYVEELPEATKKVVPTYPPEARRKGIDGIVMVQALVGKNGRVRDARVTRSVPGLDDAALSCVRQWEFKPAKSSRKPVAVWVAIPVKFVLH
jgi:TonB family protein